MILLFIGAFIVSGWQSRCFQYQRAWVQIQSAAKFMINILFLLAIGKSKIKKKVTGNGPFLNYL